MCDHREHAVRTHVKPCKKRRRAIHAYRLRAPWDSARSKSLFASFSSEKADSCDFSEENS
jgi:hypothetical protein